MQAELNKYLKERISQAILFKIFANIIIAGGLSLVLSVRKKISLIGCGGGKALEQFFNHIFDRFSS